MSMALSVSRGTESSSGNRSPGSSSSPSPSSSRLWRSAAQRNLRNQWSKLHSGKDRWLAVESEGRSHATALVNAYLSRRYMLAMDFGALKDMPGIREKACEKLDQKLELYRMKLLSAYKDMASVVSQLVKCSGSMRCFRRGSVANTLIQFSDRCEDKDDSGDCEGIPVFSFLSILDFETMAQELIEMFALELSLKRLLVIELLSVTGNEAISGQKNLISWSDELYQGEFDDLRMSNLLSGENSQPHHPRLKDWERSNHLYLQSGHAPKREVLEVYLTTWLVKPNLEMNRIDEIFSIAEKEMQVKLL